MKNNIKKSMKICSGVGWGKEDLEQKQQQAKLDRHNHNSAHQQHSFSCAVQGLVGCQPWHRSYVGVHRSGASTSPVRAVCKQRTAPKESGALFVTMLPVRQEHIEWVSSWVSGIRTSEGYL